MKNIFIYFISLFVLSGFAAKAQTPSVSLTLTYPGSAVVPGSNFFVNAAYGYSNVSGMLTVVVNFDNTMVSFCGSPGFSTAPVTGGSGTTSTLTYTFLASGGLNQAGAIQLCFTFLCPQTCFGTPLSANFTGSISSPTLSNVAAIPCSASGTVLNNWNGNNTVWNYDCVNDIVTMRLRLFQSTCYQINNPNVMISPSIGTLLSSTYGTISGNTISLPASVNPDPWGGFDFFYSIRLDCGNSDGAVLTCGAVVNGDNCGSPITNIFTFGDAVFTVPATTTTAASLTHSISATTYSAWISNTGTTPLTTTLTTIIPLVKVNSIVANTSQLTVMPGTLTVYNCTGVAATPVAFSPSYTSPATVATSLISQATYTVTNLLPGHWYRVDFNYDMATACSTPIPDCRTFTTSGGYDSYVVANACNCSSVESQFYTTVSATYCPTPEINCYFMSSDAANCKMGNDVVQICIGFRNNGTAALTNGILNFPIPSYLDYIGNLTLNSSSTGVSATSTAGNLAITLPASIPADGSTQMICFDARVNSTALNGLFGYYFNIQGDNLANRNLWCQYVIRICEDPKVEIEKLVKGSLDASYTTTGNGMAGTMATYQITVKNVGNTPITNIEVVDRMPHQYDKTIRTNTSRTSDFSIMQNYVYDPATLSSADQFDNSATSFTNVPANWTGLPTACTATGTFSLLSGNTVKINLPDPILPFDNYTFKMEVLIPAGATAGQKVCNSIAIKCDYLDVASNPYPLEIIESELACLIIAPPPCDNCKGLLGSSSLTMNPGTTTSASTPYVTATGYVTITTLQPVQEIRLSVADLQYHWDKPGCTNCKSPTITRGCLFPQSTTQTIGTLVWDDYTGNSIPTATPVNNCPEELIWKLGVMLVPGTYNIPIQLTLPKAVIPDCCELIIDKFDIKVSIKDKDCEVCDSIIRPRTDDCCTGSYWVNKQMSWSLLPHTDLGKSNAVQQAKARKTAVQLEEAVKFNKQVLSGDIFANPIPWYGVTNIDCKETYRFTEGATRTFSASYACNTSLPNCTAEVLISITTISGDFISVVSQPSPYTQTFNLPGTYRVKYVAKCGGKICNTCEFTVIVEKNCCLGIKQTSPTTITTNTLPVLGSSATTTVNLSNPAPGHYTSLNNAIVKLFYQCAPGCIPTYEWERRRGGVVIATGISTSSTISFPPPASGEDLITITTKCGNQSCYVRERFYLGCYICSIVIGGPVIGGTVIWDPAKQNK